MMKAPPNGTARKLFWLNLFIVFVVILMETLSDRGLFYFQPYRAPGMMTVAILNIIVILVDWLRYHRNNH